MCQCVKLTQILHVNIVNYTIKPCRLNIIKRVQSKIRSLIELGEDPVSIMKRIKIMIDLKVEKKNQNDLCSEVNQSIS